MYTDEKGKSITLGSLIAKGGEGEVYNISGDKNNCVKLYRERFRTKEKESKLKYMTNNSPQDIEGQSHKVCWPKEIIYEDGEFVGFLMSRAFEDSLLPYHLCQLKISKKIDSKWHETFDRDSIKGTISRLKLCVNIIAAVNRIHATNKYVIVDLKPQNLMVSPSGKVSIIDMDSVQITENEEVLFKAPVSTPEYTPPEVSGVIKKQIAISKDWDIFSLGVLIYEILCGIHPYVGSAKPPNEGLNTIQEKIKINLTHVVKGEDVFQTLPNPHKTYYSFNLDLKNIFKQIFKPYKLGVSTRPSLEEFGGILFNTVIALEEGFKEEIKRKLQEEKIQKKLFEEEAIKNYKTVKAENLELNEKVKNINETIESLKKENKAFKLKSEKPLENSKLIIAFLGIALVITLTTLGIFNNDKSKQINYYEKTVESLREEQQDLIKNNRSLTEENMSLKLNINSITVSDLTFDSYNTDTEELGFDDVRTNFSKSKIYYLFPTITYNSKKSQKLSISTKYFNPTGSLEIGPEKGFSNPPYEYNFKKGINKIELHGFGTNKGGSFFAGLNKIEIWNKSILLYSREFNVIDN